MPERRGGSASLTVEKRSDGIAVVVWDEAAPDGALDAARIEAELEAGLDDIAAWPALEGLVFASIGSDEEVAGAALRELRGLRSAAEGAAIARRTQAVAARIASLPVPSVAAVHGPCRGRALAFALAADARIASGEEYTSLALPEVRLGLLPGGGITVRLPRLVGVTAALDLLLSGRKIAPADALRYGLVDRLATHQGLIEEAAAVVRSLPEGALAKRRIAGATGSGVLRTCSSPATRSGALCCFAGSIGAPSRGLGATTRRRGACWTSCAAVLREAPRPASLSKRRLSGIWR